MFNYIIIISGLIGVLLLEIILVNTLVVGDPEMIRSMQVADIDYHPF